MGLRWKTGEPGEIGEPQLTYCQEIMSRVIDSFLVLLEGVYENSVGMEKEKIETTMRTIEKHRNMLASFPCEF